MTDPGKYRYRLTLQAKSVTRDSMGGEIVTWVDQITVLGDAIPLSGNELLLAQQVQAQVNTRFLMRYRTGVGDDWRVLWDGKPYHIVAVIDVKGRHLQLQLECTSGLIDG